MSSSSDTTTTMTFSSESPSPVSRSLGTLRLTHTLLLLSRLVLPNTLLALAFVSSLVSALAMKNHAKLVEAVGSQILAPTVLPPRYRSSLPSIVMDRLLGLISNPYSLSVLACTGALLFGGLSLPS